MFAGNVTSFKLCRQSEHLVAMQNKLINNMADVVVVVELEISPNSCNGIFYPISFIIDI